MQRARTIAIRPECAQAWAQRLLLLPLAIVAVGLLLPTGVSAQSAPQKKTNAKQPGPPVFVGTPPATAESAARPATSPPLEAASSEQKLYSQTAPLITAEQAQGIVDKFKEAYPKLGNPRMLVHVNRDVASMDKTNSPRPSPPAAKTSDIPLADRQTLRDLERLFGRPLRNAGASLADQNAANAILGDKSIHSIEGTTTAAIEKRKALALFTDAVIEVLISPKNVTVFELSGDRAYNVPDIQATVIRVSDFKILGQATSNDFLGRVIALRRFDANEITEAVALALMEDMATGAR